MHFEVPVLIFEKPVRAEWKSQYEDGFTARLAYDTAVKIYWKTKLAEAQNWNCCWCGVRMLDEPGHKKSSTIEHILPKSKGGKNNPDNYAVACYACNNRRAAKDVDDFMEEIEEARRATGSRHITQEHIKEHLLPIVQEKIDLLGLPTKVLCPSSSPCGLRRQIDMLDALIALKAGIENPFQPNSRTWKFFNSYSTPECYLFRVIHPELVIREHDFDRLVDKYKLVDVQSETYISRKELETKLKDRNVRFRSGSKSAILRKKMDGSLAMEAIIAGNPNPFEENSRRWRYFERYSKQGFAA